MAGKVKEMDGLRFGELLVIDRARGYDSKSQEAKWFCKCDCGTEKIIRGSHLRGGVIVSCGCYGKSGLHRTHNKTKTPIFYMFHDAKSRAKQRDLPFTITMDDIIVPEVCPVLGIPLLSEGSRENRPSLDRKVPEKGYVPSNICVISFRANRIKSNATPTEIRSILSYMEAS